MANSRFCKNAATDEEEILIEDLLRADFDETFNEFLKKFNASSESEVNALNFPKAYVVFLELLKKKFMYKIPYTKFFIIKLLENTPQEDKNEAKGVIEKFFEKSDLAMLPEVQKVL